MEIKSENKFKKIFKKVGVASLVCVFVVAIALTITYSIPNKSEPVATEPMSFDLPMNNAVVVKDYADDRLQYNQSLKKWEIHLAVDLASENDSVFSVCDGVVKSVDTNSIEGTVVKIEHADGFASIYSSLSGELKVKAGDSVKKGQELGKASSSANNESLSNSHLHFTLMKDGIEVDPNSYLDLQNK